MLTRRAFLSWMPKAAALAAMPFTVGMASNWFTVADGFVLPKRSIIQFVQAKFQGDSMPACIVQSEGADLGILPLYESLWAKARGFREWSVWNGGRYVSPYRQFRIVNPVACDMAVGYRSGGDDFLAILKDGAEISHEKVGDFLARGNTEWV